MSVVQSKVVLPELGENIEAADVSAVLVAVGDVIRRDQPVIEVETEKASLEVPASAAGRVAELLVHAGDTVKVGQVILVVEGEPGEAADRAPTPTSAPTAATPPDPEPEPPAVVPPSTAARAVPVAQLAAPQIGGTVPAAPSVRALARELGLAIRAVPGSGRGGRISRDDVKAYAKQLILAMEPGRLAPVLPSAPALPDFSRWGEVEREPLSKIRRATAKNLGHAWNSVPHVTQFDRADITQLEALRKETNQGAAAGTAKLTVTAVVLKLLAAALEKFPKFNAALDLAGDSIVFKKYVHIGVAVDTPRGLLVPVVRDVDRKPLQEVAAELGELAAKARDRKLKPDEMAGACFTVSNLGGLGTTYFSPIVNWPEVAILGVGRAEIQAVAEGQTFRPRLILPLSLSYDHRVIDGADAARFLRWVAEALEQPPQFNQS
jgi:pyruvate dehydrogenase E2 component (dihydrolipoamide acetyltransferase)